MSHPKRLPRTPFNSMIRIGAQTCSPVLSSNRACPRANLHVLSVCFQQRDAIFGWGGRKHTKNMCNKHKQTTTDRNDGRFREFSPSDSTTTRSRSSSSSSSDSEDGKCSPSSCSFDAILSLRWMRFLPNGDNNVLFSPCFPHDGC